MTNRFPGLHTGPLDHRATSVINAISSNAIDMGDVVLLDTNPPPEGELLPRVIVSISQIASPLAYGVAVGGDNDGIYGDGSPSTDDTTKATTGAGQTVKIVTRGRCLARVRAATTAGGQTPINIGDPLTEFTKILRFPVAGQTIVARALESIPAGNLDMIAVEVNKEGKL